MATSAGEQVYVSFDDYLAAEQSSAVRHEWLDGVIYAMGGGSIEHGRLASRLQRILGNAVEGECVLYPSDVAIYIPEAGISTYPDISMTYGPVEPYRAQAGIGEAIMNPVLLVEVLSESTERYDRGEKFAHYMRIASLREYVLVSQTEPCIEVYRRPERGHWQYEIARAGQTLELHGRTIVIDDVYRK